MDITYEDILKTLEDAKDMAKERGESSSRKVVMNRKTYDIMKKGFGESINVPIEDIQTMFDFEIAVSNLAPDDVLYLIPLEGEKRI